MGQIVFHQLPAHAGQDMVEHPGAVDDVIFLIQPEVSQIRLKKAHLRLMDVRQPLRLFDPGSRRVEGGHLIAAFCQKDRVLSFPAADLQKAQRPGWVKTLQKLQTHLIRPGPPVIALRLITFLVGGDPFFPGNVSHQRVDVRLQQPGQPGKLGDIGQRLGVFPFGHRLRGKVQPAGELLLGVAL